MFSRDHATKVVHRPHRRPDDNAGLAFSGRIRVRNAQERRSDVAKIQGGARRDRKGGGRIRTLYARRHRLPVWRLDPGSLAARADERTCPARGRQDRGQRRISRTGTLPAYGRDGLLRARPCTDAAAGAPAKMVACPRQGDGTHRGDQLRRGEGSGLPGRSRDPGHTPQGFLSLLMPVRAQERPRVQGPGPAGGGGVAGGPARGLAGRGIRARPRASRLRTRPRLYRV